MLFLLVLVLNFNIYLSLFLFFPVMFKFDVYSIKVNKNPSLIKTFSFQINI